LIFDVLPSDFVPAAKIPVVLETAVSGYMLWNNGLKPNIAV
jgi:hypothetical protein